MSNLRETEISVAHCEADGCKRTLSSHRWPMVTLSPPAIKTDFTLRNSQLLTFTVDYWSLWPIEELCPTNDSIRSLHCGCRAGHEHPCIPLHYKDCREGARIIEVRVEPLQDMFG